MSYPQTRQSPAPTGLRGHTHNTSAANLTANPSVLLLPRLNNVRQHGNGWRADCPNGHDKARGSLSIADGDGGALLLTCFACHDTPGILAAVGLEMADLFPTRIKDTSPEGRRAAREAFKRNAWAAALSVLAREALVVLVAAAYPCRGEVLSPADHDRLALAVGRIEQAKAVLA